MGRPMPPIYLDNNATTRTDPTVVAAMLPYFTECFGNPSSMHAPGTAAAAAIRTARKQVQALIGAAHDHEIVFTSGATESDNTAITSALALDPDRNEVIVSTVEHPAILSFCRYLETNRAIKVHRIPVDTAGRLNIENYMHALSERTAIVSLLWANNETGTIFPVTKLATMAKRVGAIFHTDATQAAGKLPIDLRGTAVDMISLSAHKLHGPKGIGALYVRHGTPLAPFAQGGRQQRGRRAGTENVPGIVGFGKAADIALDCLASQIPRIAALRDRLERELLQRVPDTCINGDIAARLGNTSNIAFGGVESDALLAFLDREGIACSSGSACAAGSMQPSHVLVAMQLPSRLLHSCVRFSLSRDTGDADIDRVIEILPGLVAKLRAPAGENSCQQRLRLVHG